MDELNFLKREALKCREDARRTADKAARHGMDQLALFYERQAAMLQRRAIGSH
jgi:hypothetical protein